MGSEVSKHEGRERGQFDDVQASADQSPPQAPSSGSPNDNEEDGGGGGCPMKRKDGSYSMDFSALWRKDFPHGPRGSKPLTEQEARDKTSAGCPVEKETPSGCPVKHNKGRKQFQEYNVYSQPVDPKNNMPQVANQMPAPGQSKSLSTDRVVSNIPKGGTQDDDKTWIYPSAQMFWNALARKRKLGDTTEEDMENVVAMHNNMNEKTWRKVLEWEETVSPGNNPTLLKFQGRPTDLSPKAAFKHYVLGYPLPFDRHDWTVLRDDGATVRYVIDYYYDEARASDQASSAMPRLDNPNATPSLLVDVRPALDAPTLAWNRIITMPYGRISQSTSFEPLPMRPTMAMQTQVKESVQVWQSIQASASGKTDETASNNAALINETEAKDLASSFAKVRGTCHQAAAKVDKCNSDSDCAKASMDLTICMGKILCPLQHQTLVTALAGDGPDADAKIEAALSSVSDCVTLNSSKKARAKEQYPKLFE